jgi:hypothetical protein
MISLQVETYLRLTVALALMILDPVSYISERRDIETPLLSNKREDADASTVL